MDLNEKSNHLMKKVDDPRLESSEPSISMSIRAPQSLCRADKWASVEKDPDPNTHAYEEGKDEEREEEKDKLAFESRATIFFRTENGDFESQGMGDMKIVMDNDVHAFRILMERDDGELLCNHIVCRTYAIVKNEKKKYCEWSANDFSTDDPVRRTFRVQFSSTAVVDDFYDNFQDGVSFAREHSIDPVVISGFGTRNVSYEQSANLQEASDKIPITIQQALSSADQWPPVNEDPETNKHVNKEGKDEEGDGEEDRPVFIRRATIFYGNENGEFKSQGIGDMKIVMDEDVYAFRILMERNDGEKLCNHIICRKYTIVKNEKNSNCEWSAIDFSTDDPVRRTYRVQFSSAAVVNEFYHTFQDGLSLAKQGEIDPIGIVGIGVQNTFHEEAINSSSNEASRMHLPAPSSTTKEESESTSKNDTSQGVQPGEFSYGTQTSDLPVFGGSLAIVSPVDQKIGQTKITPFNTEGNKPVDCVRSSSSPTKSQRGIISAKILTGDQHTENSTSKEQLEDNQAEKEASKSLREADNSDSLFRCEKADFSVSGTAGCTNDELMGDVDQASNTEVHIKPIVSPPDAVDHKTGEEGEEERIVKLEANQELFKPQPTTKQQEGSTQLALTMQAINTAQPIQQGSPPQSRFTVGPNIILPQAPHMTLETIAAIGDQAEDNTLRDNGLPPTSTSPSKENMPMATDFPLTVPSSNIFQLVSPILGTVSTPQTGNDSGILDTTATRTVLPQEVQSDKPGKGAEAKGDGCGIKCGDRNKKEPDLGPIVQPPEHVELVTLEENSSVMISCRVKLYQYTDKKWKERGIGQIKILHNEEAGQVRVLMRREQIHKVCANHYIKGDMDIDYKNKHGSTKEDKVLIWRGTDFSDGEAKLEQFACKFKTTDVATEFKEMFEKAKSIAQLKEKGKSSHRPAGAKPMHDINADETVSGTSFAQTLALKPDISRPLFSNTSHQESSEFSKAAFNITNICTGKPLFSYPTKSPEEPAAVPAPVTSNTLSSLFQSKVGDWDGVGCYGKNKPDSKKYFACETAKPASLTPPQNAAPAFTAGFGTIPSTNNDSVQKHAFVGFKCGSNVVSSTPDTTSAVKEFKFGSTPVKEKAADPIASSAVIKTLMSSGLKHEPHALGTATFTFSKTYPTKEDDRAGVSYQSPEAGYYVNKEGEDDHIYFEPIVKLPEKVNIKTGEEEEEVLYSHKAKLFRFVDTEWEERGIGYIKILQNNQTKKLRLLMRREKILKICLNHSLKPDMKLVAMKNSNGKAWVWQAMDYSDEEPKHENFAIKFKTEAIGEDFKEAFDAVKDGKPVPAPSSPQAAEPSPNKPASKSETFHGVPANKALFGKTEPASDASKPFSFGGMPPGTCPGFQFGKLYFGTPTSGASVFGSVSARFPTIDQKFKFGLANTSPVNSEGKKPVESPWSSSSTRFPSGNILAKPLTCEQPTKEDLDKANDVQIIKVVLPSRDRVDLAKKFLLPDAFFNNENHPDCKGCIGCDSDNFDLSTIGQTHKLTSDYGPVFGSRSSSLGVGFDFTSLVSNSTKSSHIGLNPQKDVRDNPFQCKGAGSHVFGAADPRHDESVGNGDVPSSPDNHLEPLVSLPKVVDHKNGEESKESKAGKWDCVACCVRNTPDSIKCVACEKVKPGCDEEQSSEISHSPKAESNQHLSNSGDFSFGNPALSATQKNAAPECTTGFKFGSDSSTTGDSEKKPAFSGLKFGSTVVSSTPDTTSVFTFGRRGTLNRGSTPTKKESAPSKQKTPSIASKPFPFGEMPADTSQVFHFGSSNNNEKNTKSTMLINWTEYSGLHQRLALLREMGLGLDGTIIAKGGEIRIHLQYLAGCSQTLFNQITLLIRKGECELNFKDTPVLGVEALVDYCYSGSLKVNADNFSDVVDAALAMEFRDVVGKCIRYAVNARIGAKVWSEFLRVAFKYALSFEGDDFIPNLILEYITGIPREAFVGSVKPADIRVLLKNGTKKKQHHSYVENIFIEILVKDEDDIQALKETLSMVLKQYSNDKQGIVFSASADRNKVMLLLDLSLQLDYVALVKACTKALERFPLVNLDLSRIISLVTLYKTIDSSQFLKSFCCSIFCNLPPNISVDDLCTMLEGNCLYSLSEFEIFKTSVKWLNDNIGDVKAKNRVISLVRFGLMSREQLDCVFRDFSLDMQGCGDLLLPAMKYHLCEMQKPLQTGLLNKIRLVAPRVYIFGGEYRLGKLCRNVTTLNVENLGLTTRLALSPVNTEMSRALTKGAVAELNGFFFLTGGCVNSDAFDYTFRFDPRTNSWLELACMTHKRHSHTLTALPKSNSLLVVGGSHLTANHNTAEMYDVTENTWRKTANIPGNYSKHASCYNPESDQVFVSGGDPNGKTMLCYSNNIWEKKNSMLYSRMAHSMTAAGGTIFVTGGIWDFLFCHEMSTECYDTGHDQWTRLSSMLHPTSYSCSVLIGNHLYVMGGRNNRKGEHLKLIQRYNITKDTWELCDERLPEAKYGACSACLAVP